MFSYLFPSGIADVILDFLWILNCTFIVCCELDAALYLWFKDKKSSIFTHPKNEWFLKKTGGADQKKWKYSPFFMYFILFILGADWFNFRYYFPDIYTILIVLLVIHSIVFIKEWMREKKEDKNNNPPLIPKEEGFELVHK